MFRQTQRSSEIRPKSLDRDTFSDLGKSQESISEEITHAAREVIDSGWFILGDKVKSFESEFSTYCGVDHAIGTANGLDALTLIFRAYLEMGLMKEGDHVLVPSNTYIASILSITENRLVPILIEPINPTTTWTRD